MLRMCSLSSRALAVFGLIFVTLSAVAISRAQDASSRASGQSENATGETSALAAAAKQAKGSKTRAKRVFTDEDMEVSAGPLPRLRMEGSENGDEVISAIASYKGNHTPEQTERAVRIWFERYDEMLSAAIQENADMQVLRNANTSNGYELCQESG